MCVIGRYSECIHVCFSLPQAIGGVNGPLMEKLAQLIKYHDPGCVEMFREGCDIIGDLPLSGIGTPIAGDCAGKPDIQGLVRNRFARNSALVKSLKEDCHSKELLEIAAEDARKHRMSPPRVICANDLERYTLSPRFCIEQGTDSIANARTHNMCSLLLACGRRQE